MARNPGHLYVAAFARTRAFPAFPNSGVFGYLLETTQTRATKRPDGSLYWKPLCPISACFWRAKRRWLARAMGIVEGERAMFRPSRPATATCLASALVLWSVWCPQAGAAAETGTPRGQDSTRRPQPTTKRTPLRGLELLDDPADKSGISETPFRPPQRFAVCVGIDGYQDGSGYGRLQYAGQDAVGVAEALLEKCQFDQILLLTDAQADAVDALSRKYPAPRLQAIRDVSRNAIRDRSEKFLTQATSPDDAVLFYFAGHGDANPQPCLIAGDYHRVRAPRNVLSLSGVFDWSISQPVQAQNRVFIFDACRSSPAGDHGQVLVPGFQNALAQPGCELIVLSGCEANQSAHEDASLKHGRFSWALIQALSGKAYKEGEKNLLINHVFEYVGQTFQQREGWATHQTPKMFSSAGRLFAIGHRKIIPPKGISVLGLKRLQELRLEARQQYRRNELESADQNYGQCLWVLDLVSEKNEEMQRLWVKVLSERACVLYRLGLFDESSSLAEQAKRLPPDDPALRLALCERDAYLHATAGRFAETKDALDAAIAGSDDTNPVAPYVWSQHGDSLMRLGKLEDAVGSFEQAAALSEQLGCLEDAAAALKSAGYCCAQIGSHEKAYQLLLKAYELLRQRSKNKMPLQGASLLHQMSILLARIGRLDDAEKLGRESLAMRVEMLGEDHPRTATSRNNLARLYCARGEYVKAEPLLVHSLDVMKNEHGEEHPNTAASMNNLAGLYYVQGAQAKAETLYLRSLEITEKLLGPDHPDTAASLNSLALLYEAQGKYAKAEPLLVRTLAIREKVLGREHPNTAASLNNLATLYVAQDRYSDAESLYAQGLLIMQKAVGNRDPITAVLLNNFAVLNGARGDRHAFNKLSDEAASIFENADHATYPDFATFIAIVARENGLAALPTMARIATLDQIRDKVDAEGRVIGSLFQRETGWATLQVLQWSIELKEPGPAGDFRPVSPNHSFRTGDRFRLRIESATDLFVYVLRKGSDGSLAVDDEPRRVRQGEAGFLGTFQFAAPAGKEQISVLASSYRLPWRKAKQLGQLSCGSWVSPADQYNLADWGQDDPKALLRPRRAFQQEGSISDAIFKLRFRLISRNVDTVVIRKVGDVRLLLYGCPESDVKPILLDKLELMHEAY